MISSFKQYLSEENKSVYFTFGRMNPPTIGHGKLLDKLSSVSGKNAYYIFISQSQDAKKNPLSYSDKVKHSRKMFPKHARQILLDKKIKTVFDAATKFYNDGYKNIVMVVGQDRVNEFYILLNKYNGVKGRYGFYNFESINVVSAGERDPDSEGIEGMSASKQRANASENDFASFSQGVPSQMSTKDTRKLFNDVRLGMGLKEETNFKRHVELLKVSPERETYVKGNLFGLGDEVVIKESGQLGKVTRLGANYVVVEVGENVVRKWLNDVEKIEEFSETKKSFRDLYGEQIDPINSTKEKIKREKEVNKQRHDKMMDRARIQSARNANRSEETDPCWKDYEMVGMKKKGDVSVPNCVPKQKKK